MDYMIAAHHIEPQAIVSIRDRRTQDDLPGFIKAAIPELMGRLRLLGVAPSGPPFVIYHDFGADGIDAEASVPIREEIATAGQIGSRVVPAMTVARTVHVGPYEKLGDAYAALWSWIRSHGFEIAGPVRERYLNGPGERVPPTEYLTEIEMPIVPVVIAAPV
ncbi:MAG TPA: GyrI-like domain-containing protein [Candidatus Limnocylindrales bacterium]|jgi:effector-binding domain-containing protein|nr:GyrI-like domain-containing protein [Candidatus Limnocylindrales bacterium]